MAPSVMERAMEEYFVLVGSGDVTGQSIRELINKYGGKGADREALEECIALDSTQPDHATQHAKSLLDEIQ
jgi:hypothetical protein|tara:strand:+ start:463 stop:675 length:213 start_codon:yes stop_codon:yes gene_type:complete